MNAIEKLKSVLCSPDGEVCIHGSEEDRRIVAKALSELQSAPVAPKVADLRAELLMFAGRLSTEKRPLVFAADRVVDSTRVITIVDEYLAAAQAQEKRNE